MRVLPLVAATPLLLAAYSAPAPRADESAIARVAWLAGCWERSTATRVVEEQWMRPRGGTMLGMSRTVRGDSTVEWEHVRIHDEGGTLVYHAQPSRQPAASFRATVVADDAITFENPAHDFPQRIIYRRVGADSLHARIEGTMRGQARGVDFPYRRASCGG